jgi:hypothetical protein
MGFKKIHDHSLDNTVLSFTIKILGPQYRDLKKKPDPFLKKIYNVVINN